jgi:hypothetical protein
LVKLKGITKAKAAKLSARGDSSADAIFLYDDGCVPTQSKANMKAYLARIEMLAKLKVERDI